MSEFDILQTAAAGMDAQRSALDVAARNVAAAEADGSHFERLVPRFAVATGGEADVPGSYEPPEEPGDAESAEAMPPVRYLGAVPRRGTEVDAVTEMVSVLDAQRAYEANASVFDLGKRLAERTIDMGRVQ